MLFKLSNLNSNLALTLGYLNPALNNSALGFFWVLICGPIWSSLSLEIQSTAPGPRNAPLSYQRQINSN